MTIKNLVFLFLFLHLTANEPSIWPKPSIEHSTLYLRTIHIVLSIR